MVGTGRAKRCESTNIIRAYEFKDLRGVREMSDLWRLVRSQSAQDRQKLCGAFLALGGLQCRQGFATKCGMLAQTRVEILRRALNQVERIGGAGFGRFCPTDDTVAGKHESAMH